MTDYQRTKVYTAEQEARSEMGRAITLDSAEAFAKVVDRFTTSDWWSDTVGQARPAVQISPRLHRSARLRNERLVMVGSKPGASWSWSTLVAAHELAHFAHLRHILGGAAHGPAFCGWMLALTRSMVGAEAEAIVARHYAHRGVDVKRIPNISPAEIPVIGLRSPLLVSSRPDPEFLARRAEKLAASREDRRRRIHSGAALSI